jgi:hypothetical protein
MQCLPAGRTMPSCCRPAALEAEHAISRRNKQWGRSVYGAEACMYGSNREAQLGPVMRALFDELPPNHLAPSSSLDGAFFSGAPFAWGCGRRRRAHPTRALAAGKRLAAWLAAEIGSSRPASAREIPDSCRVRLPPGRYILYRTKWRHRAVVGEKDGYATID